MRRRGPTSPSLVNEQIRWWIRGSRKRTDIMPGHAPRRHTQLAPARRVLRRAERAGERDARKAREVRPSPEPTVFAVNAPSPAGTRHSPTRAFVDEMLPASR